MAMETDLVFGMVQKTVGDRHSHLGKGDVACTLKPEVPKGASGP